MKYFLAAVCLISAITFSACTSIGTAAVASSEPAKDKKTPVLVELFTSEGCSSCPPADRLLVSISGDQPYASVDAITLGFHVDYWDHGGWRDRFSSREYTKRQEEYSRQFGLGSTYTPQIVIDGAKEVVGNNKQNVGDAINAQTESAKAAIKLDVKGESLSVAIDQIPEQKGSAVLLAVAESGLRSSVGGGENAGRTLEHASVVRELRQIGKIDAGQKAYSAAITLPTNAEWKTDRVRYVVFVQDNSTLKVIGVAATPGK